ncbi:MAG: hypothetical protein QXP77_02350 [Candidatus Aenigmatarchaeota archaeon]
MKVKIPKSAIISGFLIFLMLGSTLTYFFMNLLSPTGRVTLPEKNIIDFELSFEQENLAIRQGKTLVKFFYSNECEGCFEKKDYLENLANKYKDQIILQEILLNISSYEIRFSSFYGQKILKNSSEEEIFKTFCDIMFSPPAECIKFE